MTFRHVRTDDPTSPHNDSRTRLLEKVLARHAAEGIDVLELRRQMGKAGYVPTEHRWEDDGHGDDLTDDDGGLLLIGGMPPADLAAEIIDTARQHTEETNERKNYRVVGLRRVEGEDGDEEQEELFRFLLPAVVSMLGLGVMRGAQREPRARRWRLRVRGQLLGNTSSRPAVANVGERALAPSPWVDHWCHADPSAPHAIPAVSTR